MRWLLHGNITDAAGEAIKRHGHEIKRPADIGLTSETPPADVLAAAHKAQLDVISSDLVLAQTPFEQNVRFGRTLVLLAVDAADVEQDDAIDRLFSRYKRLAPGRLYTVTGSRVKVRQLPTGVKRNTRRTANGE